MDPIAAAQLAQEQWARSAARRRVSDLARELGPPTYAVGGAVRDAVMGREPHDWDLLSLAPESLALAVRSALGATLVPLHDDPYTCRLVIGVGTDRREEIDLAAPRGDGLEQDLAARDFTVNSMAWSITDGAAGVVDPCGGLRDLEARLLRGNSAQVFRDDPLRCLRAFRLSGELGLSLEPATTAWISAAAAGLARVAGERVGAEFSRLVVPPGLAARIRAMDESGVLCRVIPELETLKGVRQGGFHHLDVWGHTLALLDELEGLLERPGSLFPRTSRTLAPYAADDDARLRLKLAGLLHDIAKPRCACVQDGWVRFIGHEKVGAEVAAAICRRLRLPGEVCRSVSRLVLDHMRPIMLVNGSDSVIPTVSAIRRLVADCDPDGFGILLLAAADIQACLGPKTDPADRATRLDILDRAFAAYVDWTETQSFEPLLRGRHLIQHLGLEPGPEFSEILKAVERAQIDGEISSTREALALARRLIEGAAEERSE